MAGRPRKKTALVLCAPTRWFHAAPEVGTLIHAGRTGRKPAATAYILGWRDSASDRCRDIRQRRTIWRCPLRRVSQFRRAAALLVPAGPHNRLKPTTQAEGSKAKWRRNAQKLRQARSELAEAQAGHSAARKRMTQAQEAVNSLGETQ